MHRKAPLIDRTFQQLVDVRLFERDVTHREIKPHALAKPAMPGVERGMFQRGAGRDDSQVILHSHELSVLADFQVWRRIAEPRNHMAHSGDDYRITGDGSSPFVHSL